MRSYNPWAICTASVGRRNKVKYERCVRKVKARIGMKNPAISAAWSKMTDRQREYAMRYAGVAPARASGYSSADWTDLDHDVKAALLRGWNMGSVGTTTRRFKGETTRQVPVLTNPEILSKEGVVVQRSRNLRGIREYVSKHSVKFIGLHRKPDGGGTLYVMFDNQERFKTDFASYEVLKNFVRNWRNVYGVLLMVEGRPSGTVYYDQPLLKPGAHQNRARKNGTKGAYPFASKIEQYRKYTLDQLVYALADAQETAGIWKGQDPATENWYRDDVFTIHDEIKRRQGSARKNPNIRRSVPIRVRLFLVNGMPEYGAKHIPEWLLFWDRFYTKFGITPEQFEAAIRRLSDADKRNLHDMIGPTFPEEAVHFVMSKMKSKKSGDGGKMEMVVANRRKVRRNPDIKVGDAVKVSAKFLRSTGQYTGPICFAVGVVTAIQDLGAGFRIATVKWDRPGVGEKMNVKNLLPAKAPEYFENRARRNAPSRLQTYYVAKYRPAYPQKGEFWTASTVIDTLPPTVVGKLFKIAARTKADAIREAQKIR
jgi:hypothetical protein